MISQERIDQLEPGERYLLHAPDVYPEPIEIIFDKRMSDRAIRYFREIRTHENPWDTWATNWKKIEGKTWFCRTILITAITKIENLEDEDYEYEELL